MKLKKNPFVNPVLISEPYSQGKGIIPGEVRSLFAHPKRPLYVDLGTGAGQFLSQASRTYPLINWIGIEKKSVHLFQAIRKRKITPYSNLRYIWMDVAHLQQIFHSGQVDRFYLNFSTPWEDPKKRLTHRRFLKIYEQLLAPGGEILFKTDRADLYDFSLEEFEEMDWEILEETRDLHYSEWAEQNIWTEWEDKSVDRICYARVKK